MTAHPSVGVLFAHVPAESAQSQPGALWKECAQNGWSATFLSAPFARADEFIAPLPSHSPMKLQRRLKAELDAAGALDPGRFWGGI